MFDIIIFALVSSASATIFMEGPCPAVKAVDNFDIAAYANGTWFEIARYPNNWENRGDCVAMVYNPEKGANKFKLTDVIDDSLSYYEGYIKFAEGAGKSGIINHYSASYESAEGANVVPVYILSIDYNKYSIGYECKYNETTKMRHEYAWVMSRTKKLEGETKTTVDNFLKSSVINPSLFQWIHFTDNACKVVKQ